MAYDTALVHYPQGPPVPIVVMLPRWKDSIGAAPRTLHLICLVARVVQFAQCTPVFMHVGSGNTTYTHQGVRGNLGYAYPTSPEGPPRFRVWGRVKRPDSPTHVNDGKERCHLAATASIYAYAVPTMPNGETYSE